MAWDIYFTAVAEEWILALDDKDYTAMLAAIELKNRAQRWPAGS